VNPAAADLETSAAPPGTAIAAGVERRSHATDSAQRQMPERSAKPAPGRSRATPTKSRPAARRGARLRVEALAADFDLA
jgi:hypothetical protein